jgi:hypothetical protein
VLVLADQGEVLWAVDTSHGCAALLIGLLLAENQPMAYLTGLAVHHASAGYRGQGKTDARDAHVIAPDRPGRPALRATGRHAGLHRLGPCPCSSHPLPVPRAAGG